jgi:hypothetical protein
MQLYAHGRRLVVGHGIGEPAAAPGRQQRRLVHLDQAEHADVERAQAGLAAGRAGKLNMVDPHWPSLASA